MHRKRSGAVVTQSVNAFPLLASEAVAFLGDEIARLSQRLLRLEEGIEVLCKTDTVSKGDAMVRLQEVDILFQSAEALAAYAQALSAEMRDDSRINVETILQSLPLRDVAARLMGAAMDTTQNGFELL